MAKKKAAKAAKAKKSAKKAARSARKATKKISKAVKKSAKRTARKKAARVVKPARKATRKAVRKPAVRAARSSPRPKPVAPLSEALAAQPFMPAAEPERGAKPFDPDAVELEAGLQRVDHDDAGGFGEDDEGGLDDDEGPRRARAQQPPGPPQVGARAPEFDLSDQAGRRHALANYRGQRVVLYFYPKDDTPGCTTEACGFRDALGEFSDRGVVVLGISPDSARSHARFADKFGLTFPLLADEEHQVAMAYGVWVEKQMYGRRYMGVARNTFLIGPDGRIERIFSNVQAKGHEQEVLAALAKA